MKTNYIVDNPWFKPNAGWVCIYCRTEGGEWRIRLLEDREAYIQFLAEEKGKLFTAYGYEFKGADTKC